MGLGATLLTEARTDRSITDIQENRTRTHGLITMMENDTANLLDSGEITEARTLDSRVVKIPVLNRLDRTTSFTDSRSCNPTTEDSTSALQSITWNTATFTTTVTPVEHADNEIAMTRKHAHQLGSGIRAVLNDIETTGYTTLNTNRSQVLTNSMDSIIDFNTTFNQLEIPWDKRSTMFNYIKYIMKENAFDGPFNFVNSWGIAPEVDYYRNQGSGNSANTSFQFGEYNFYGTEGITNNSLGAGTFFVMPMGSVAIVYWVSKQAREGGETASANGRIVYGTADVPGIGQMATKEFTKCVDISSTYAGVTDALQYVTEYSVDYAVIPLYNSDLASLSNAIVKGVLFTEAAGSGS